MVVCDDYGFETDADARRAVWTFFSDGAPWRHCHSLAHVIGIDVKAGLTDDAFGEVGAGGGTSGTGGTAG